MQARWIQLPFDPVHGTFDDTPLVRALEARPAAAVREYFFHFEDRPHLGCFVQWRRAVGRGGPNLTAEEELDEILERLEAEERERDPDGLRALEALEVRRLTPDEAERLRRGPRGETRRETRRNKGRSTDRSGSHSPNGTATQPAHAPDEPLQSVNVAADEAPTPEEEPLEGPALRAAEALRAWRNTRRRELDVPAYRVLTNRQLEAVARRRPDTLGALAEIGGFGPATLATHGEAILACLKVAEASSHDFDPDPHAPAVSVATPPSAPDLPSSAERAAPAESAAPMAPAASS